MKNERINAVGIEVEGEWSAEAVAKLGRHPATEEVKRDGSIHTCNGHENMLLHEITTVPLKPNSPRLWSFLDAIERMDEEGAHHWNTSMGFHIHVSFTPSDAERLPDCIASSPFYLKLAQDLRREFPKEWKERAEGYYSRVRGATGDALDERMLAEHADHTWRHERYEFINTEAFQRHGTVEFRFFPAGSAKDMKRYLAFIIAEVNEALAWNTLKAETVEPITDGTLAVEEVCEVQTDQQNEQCAPMEYNHGIFRCTAMHTSNLTPFYAFPAGGVRSLGRVYASPLIRNQVASERVAYRAPRVETITE